MKDRQMEKNKSMKVLFLVVDDVSLPSFYSHALSTHINNTQVSFSLKKSLIPIHDHPRRNSSSLSFCSKNKLLKKSHIHSLSALYRLIHILVITVSTLTTPQKQLLLVCLLIWLWSSHHQFTSPEMPSIHLHSLLYSSTSNVLKLKSKTQCLH